MGSAVLSVDTAEQVDEDKFEEVLEINSDLDGYQVTSVVDINLNQVVYKGTEDVDNAWNTSMSTLKSNAVITLNLNHYYDDVAVVHEVHDEQGSVTGYDILETEYNADDGTVSFETNSFSNYAIVTTAQKVPAYVIFDSWGEGEDAQAHVSVKSGIDPEQTEVLSFGRLLLSGADDVVFTLIPPQERVIFTPIVDVRYYMEEQEPMIQRAELEAVNRNQYSFTLPAFEGEYQWIKVEIVWSDFEYLNPSEDEVMYYVAVDDQSETSGDYVHFNVKPIASESLGNETKYIFSNNQDVVMDIVTVPGRRLLSVKLNDVSYVGAMSEVTGQVKDIAELKHNGVYQITDEFPSEDTYRGVELVFVPCQHSYNDADEQEETWTVKDEGHEATCIEDGLTAGSHCSECGEIVEAQKTVPASGHKAVTDAGQEATCTEDGITEGKHCSVCDEVLISQETVKAKGHTYVDGVCAVCGDVKENQALVIPDSIKEEVEIQVSDTIPEKIEEMIHKVKVENVVESIPESVKNEMITELLKEIDTTGKDVQIKVVNTVKATEADLKSEKKSITFEISPEAVITVNGEEVKKTKLKNNQLSGSRDIEITLPTNGLDVKEIVHKSEGYPTEYITEFVISREGAVTFRISHFSSFTLNEEITKPTDSSTSGSAVVDTGDHADLLLHGGVGMIAMICGIAILIFRRKHA